MKKISIFVYKNFPDPKVGASNLVFSEFINYLEARYNTIKIYIVNPKSNLQGRSSQKYIISEAMSKEIFEINNTETRKIPNSDIAIFLDLKSGLIANQVIAKKKFIWLGDLEFLTILEHYKVRCSLNLIKILDFPRVILRILISVVQYLKILGHMDNIIISSINSEKYLNLLGFNSIFLPYPLKFDNELVTPSIKSEEFKIKNINFLFFGNHEGLGTKSTIKEFKHVVIPAMEKVFGQNRFEIIIAGELNQTSLIFKELKTLSSITFEGYVENINKLINDVDYCIFPIKAKIGNRSRIIHAMSQGKVVITHRYAASTNPFLQNRENCMTYGTKNDLIEILKLLRDHPQNIKYIAKKARESYKETYESERAMGRIHEVIFG
jgi:glycosyltransferase involved in cell wall biosynthesis